MNTESISAHVLREQKIYPPGGLLDESGRGGHKRRDDVDRLCDIGHSDVLGLADKDVAPHAHGEGVRNGVELFSPLIYSEA